MYCGRTSGRATAAGRDPEPVDGPVAGGIWGAWAEADMATSWLAQETERETESGALLLGRHLLSRLASRRDDLTGETVELRGDLRVVRERERNARVERGGDRLVVARERVVNAEAERGLDLLGRDHVLIGGAVEQDANPLAANAELTHTIDQPLRI